MERIKSLTSVSHMNLGMMEMHTYGESVTVQTMNTYKQTIKREFLQH